MIKLYDLDVFVDKKTFKTSDQNDTTIKVNIVKTTSTRKVLENCHLYFYHT